MIEVDHKSLNGDSCVIKDHSRLPSVDPWIAIGTTTIDGDMSTIASAFGLMVPGLYAVLAAFDEDRVVSQVGGRNVRIRERCLDPEHGGVVTCDIVRRKAEIDAERRAHIDFVSKWAADPWRIRPTVMRQVCQECGPHGNAGRVLLLESWVDCTTCRPPVITVDLQDAIEVHRTRSLKIVPPGANRINIDDTAETVKFTGWRDAETTSATASEQAVRLRNGMFGHVEHVHENEPRYLVRVRAVNGDARKLVSTEDIKTFIPAVPPEGLAYPTADDVRSSLPTPVESREYLGHVLKTFTPPPIPVRLTFNDDNIGNAMRMMDEHIDKCQARLRELGLA